MRPFEVALPYLTSFFRNYKIRRILKKPKPDVSDNNEYKNNKCTIEYNAVAGDEGENTKKKNFNVFKRFEK